MQPIEKRNARTLTAASGPDPAPKGRLFYITDESTQLSFLVDSGAEISILPASSSDKKRARGFDLQAVNRTTISTYGERSFTLNFGLRRTFRWIFVIADVKVAILGADFFSHFGLLVDLKRRKLWDGLTHLSVSGKPSKMESLCLTRPKPTTASATFFVPFRPLRAVDFEVHQYGTTSRTTLKPKVRQVTQKHVV